jgi:hypothetical protein
MKKNFMWEEKFVVIDVVDYFIPIVVQEFLYAVGVMNPPKKR